MTDPIRKPQTQRATDDRTDGADGETVNREVSSTADGSEQVDTDWLHEVDVAEFDLQDYLDNPSLLDFSHVFDDQLSSTEYLFVEITHPLVPLYSLEELHKRLVRFLKHQHDDREAIVSTGSPKSSFADCRWLSYHLDSLYSEADLVYEHHQHPDKWLPKADREQLNAKRPLLFEAKMAVLQILCSSLERESAKSLLEDCVRAITRVIEPSFMRFCLRADVQHPATADQRCLVGFGDKGWMPPRPGGIGDLIAVAAHVEKEIRCGTLAATYEPIKEALQKHEVMGPCAYDELVQLVGKAKVDQAEKAYTDGRVEEVAFWKFYTRKLQGLLLQAPGDPTVTDTGCEEANDGDSPGSVEQFTNWLLLYNGVGSERKREREAEVPEFEYFDDYRVVIIRGIRIALSKAAAATIRAMHQLQNEGHHPATWAAIQTRIQENNKGLDGKHQSPEPNTMSDALKGLTKAEKEALCKRIGKDMYRLNAAL